MRRGPSRVNIIWNNSHGARKAIDGTGRDARPDLRNHHGTHHQIIVIGHEQFDVSSAV